jgi:ligand-binding sensor domain-containing protein
MKKLSCSVKSLFAMMVICSFGRAQNPQWLNYTNGDQVNVIVEEGNYIWAGTAGGLVKLNKTTGIPTFFNKANSGLPGNHVRSMVIDENGVKWIGTDWGLARFDGTNWTAYNTTNSDLPYDCVESTAIDGKGDKWIFTHGDLWWGQAELCKFDGTNWTKISVPQSIHVSMINFVVATNKDGNINLWIGSSSGLARVDDTGWTIYNTSNSGLPDNSVTSITSDANGIIWIATPSGLAVFDGTTWTTYTTLNSGLPSDNVRSIAMDGIGNKWIGTFGGGLSVFDGAVWKTYNSSNSGLPDDRVYLVTIDGQDNKWIIPYAFGMTRFDGGNWTTYNTSNSALPDNFVTAIAFNNKDNAWISTNSALLQFDGKHWLKYDDEGEVPSMANANDGSMWIASSRSGFGKFDGTSWTSFDITDAGLSTDVLITCIAMDKNGDVWVGANGALVQLHETKLTVYQYGANIQAIAIDGKGNKWIGTADRGLVAYDGSTWMTFHDWDSELPDNCIYSLAIDNNGDKWIGTEHGLAQFDDLHWTIYDTSNSNIPGNFVSHIAIDEQGNKWIVTEGGLTMFDGITWNTCSDTNSGLPHAGISALAIDAKGNKWIGTDGSGVAIYNENGIVTGIENQNMKNEKFKMNNFVLNQNFPNPFNPETEITYQLPMIQHVSFTIYDILGRRIRTLVNERKEAGNYSVYWDGRDESGILVPSGVYLCRIQTEKFCETGKAILCR